MQRPYYTYNTVALNTLSPHQRNHQHRNSFLKSHILSNKRFYKLYVLMKLDASNNVECRMVLTHAVMLCYSVLCSPTRLYTTLLSLALSVALADWLAG